MHDHGRVNFFPQRGSRAERAVVAIGGGIAIAFLAIYLLTDRSQPNNRLMAPVAASTAAQSGFAVSGPFGLEKYFRSLGSGFQSGHVYAISLPKDWKDKCDFRVEGGACHVIRSSIPSADLGAFKPGQIVRLELAEKGYTHYKFFIRKGYVWLKIKIVQGGVDSFDWFGRPMSPAELEGRAEREVNR